MMSIKTFLVSLVIGIMVIGLLVLVLNRPKNQLSNPSDTFINEFESSSFKRSFQDSLIEYADPSGFTFSYPDNLSITKGELDETTYADLQLFSKDVNGSLSLKISDNKFKTLDEWVKLNTETSKEVKLGNLKALEIKTSDRLLLGALDQGIFFTIEMPLIEESFWMQVYGKVLESFSFAAPDTGADSSSDAVTFEGEEVVE